jgi:hypothetical protein
MRSKLTLNEWNIRESRVLVLSIIKRVTVNIKNENKKWRVHTVKNVYSFCLTKSDLISQYLPKVFFISTISYKNQNYKYNIGKWIRRGKGEAQNQIN